MRLYHFSWAIFIFALLSCNAGRRAYREGPVFPEAGKGKWWIINTVFQNSSGKDVHYNALVSMDELAGKRYAACFSSLWNADDTNKFYTGLRSTAIPAIKYRKKFPLKFWIPANGATGIDWSLKLKRNSLAILTEFLSKTEALNGYTEFLASFSKQTPFILSAISAAPQAWAVKPVPADIKLEGNLKAVGLGRVHIRIFSDKELLLKKSAAASVHWVDIDLNSGKTLSILFSTDDKNNVKTEAVTLWDEQQQIMAKPEIAIQAQERMQQASAASEKYLLYFSIVLPQHQLDLIIKPRLQQQEIAANKNSFWMGAVEATDRLSGRQAGKGNMYIFKQ